MQSIENNSVAVCVERLEQVLREACELNAQLLTCLREEREALRTADTANLAQRLRCERELVDAIDRLEQRRKVVTGALATTLGLETDGEEIRLREIAGKIGEPHESQLNQLGGELRTLIEQVREEGGVMRESCASLLNHVRGLMQTLRAGLSETKVYGPDGRIGGPASAGAVDVKT
jgi:flagellar biosynthesis/type III secretory pathway chaperone